MDGDDYWKSYFIKYSILGFHVDAIWQFLHIKLFAVQIRKESILTIFVTLTKHLYLKVSDRFWDSLFSHETWVLPNACRHWNFLCKTPCQVRLNMLEKTWSFPLTWNPQGSHNEMYKYWIKTLNARRSYSASRNTIRSLSSDRLSFFDYFWDSIYSAMLF